MGKKVLGYFLDLEEAVRFFILFDKAVIWFLRQLLGLKKVARLRLSILYSLDRDVYVAFFRACVLPKIMTQEGPILLIGKGEHTQLILRAFPELNTLGVSVSDSWDVGVGGSLCSTINEFPTVFLSTVTFQQQMIKTLGQAKYTGRIVAIEDYLPTTHFLNGRY